MTRVLVWLSDNAGPMHYRFDVPIGALDPHKWQVDYGWPEQANGYDVVIGQRLHGDQPAWLELCARGDKLCIYEIDDDLTRLPPRHMSYPYFTPQTDGTIANLRAAHRVTVPNEAFRQRMLELAPGADIRILPVCLPDEIYTWPLIQPSDRLVIGWGGSWAAQHDWDGAGLLELLANWMAVHPEAEFHTMGADYTQGRISRLRVSPMQPPMPFYRGIDFHIALCPLEDHPFNWTKQHTKALYCSARGAVPVCSPVGAYPDWCPPGISTSIHSWYEALDLLADINTRMLRAEAARLKAEDWTISRHIHLWEKAWTP